MVVRQQTRGQVSEAVNTETGGRKEPTGKKLEPNRYRPQQWTNPKRRGVASEEKPQRSVERSLAADDEPGGSSGLKRNELRVALVEKEMAKPRKEKLEEGVEETQSAADPKRETTASQSTQNNSSPALPSETKQHETALQEETEALEESETSEEVEVEVVYRNEHVCRVETVEDVRLALDIS